VGELSLNERALHVAEELAVRAEELGAAVHTVGGARVIDAGVTSRGCIGAGVLLARACLADLATVSVVPSQVDKHPLPAIAVEVSQPIAACMASQYAGWQIKADKFFAMGSGPMRAAYGGEELFHEIVHRERPAAAVGVLETGELPTEAAVTYIAGKCRIEPAKVTLLVARTASLAGGVQVVARSVETALHKLHTLKFDLKRIVAGHGVAPLPPVAKNDTAAIGRTNDAVLYGGAVTLYLTGDDESLQSTGEQLPSSTSRDYGRPFKEVFKGYGYDFYKIDPLLFSPALVSLQNLDTGRTHTFGALNHEVLAASFFE
jgi:methenyltetrahydromethanopterin cyclohydrolase